MLLEFSVANFRSIYKKQTLSMVASTNKELAGLNIYEEKNLNLKIVKSAVIYGSNASGKSNLLRAALFAKEFIVLSVMSMQEGMSILTSPFAFLSNAKNEPTEFDFMFVEEGVRYNYYFAVTGERVTKEWLVAYPNGKPQRWFEREFNKESGKYNWFLGSNFKGEKAQQNIWQNSTRANALFLSAAIQLNNDQLKPVFRWFQTKLEIITLGMQINPLLSFSLLENSAKKHLMDQFMQVADLGIESLQMKSEELTINIHNESGNLNMNANMQISSPQMKREVKWVALQAMHKKLDSDELAPLYMEEESDGTKKIFEFAGAWIKALEEGKVILVDELDRSLHPLMTRFLVSLFHDGDKNPKGSQLIFTTHDTTLLDTELFRRDQVWFIEKQNSCSNLYSLLDYRPRKDEALERGYLKGRYGAIPFIGTFKF